jgi:hypothetical protein
MAVTIWTMKRTPTAIAVVLRDFGLCVLESAALVVLVMIMARPSEWSWSPSP